MSFAAEFPIQRSSGKIQSVDLAAGTAATDLIAASPGKVFLVHYAYLEASGTSDIHFLDGATQISGNIAMGTTAAIFRNGGAPILRTVTPGNALRVVRGTSVELDGWLLYEEADR